MQDQLSHAVIGAAVKVHRELGPGLLESVYAACLCHELGDRRIAFQRDLRIPVRYGGRPTGTHLRLDLLIDGQMIIELKSVDTVLDIHRAQLLTYLRLTGIRRGLLVNFNVLRLVDGVSRFVL